MESRYDVIVVGARCAGSPLAMLLARLGAKVLLVDRATFPADIPHGHFIHREGPRRLASWGLLERIAEVTPPVTEALTHFGDFPLVSRNLSVDGIAWGYAPRRYVLDEILVDAAVEAGAELREGFSVDDFVFEGERMVGIRGRSREGKHVEERATMTVGADGRNSRLARAVQAPVYDEAPTLLCYYFSYWSGVETAQFEMYLTTEKRRAILSHVTTDGLYAVFVGIPRDELTTARTDIEKSFMDTLDIFPDFSERIRAGRREERFYGATDLPNFFRRPHGPGWALVGDAGHHKDPWLALGVSDAFRDAEFLANAIAEGLSGRRAEGEALAEYEQKRNEASIALYKENLAMASFAPLPEIAMALRSAVKESPEDATQLLLARVGIIPPDAFFRPENLQRLLAGAAA
jgi:flavin-dependent dehydrogenase